MLRVCRGPDADGPLQGGKAGGKLARAYASGSGRPRIFAAFFRRKLDAGGMRRIARDISPTDRV